MAAQNDKRTADYFQDGFELFFLHNAGNGNLVHGQGELNRIELALMVPKLVLSNQIHTDKEVFDNWYFASLHHCLEIFLPDQYQKGSDKSKYRVGKGI